MTMREHVQRSRISKEKSRDRLTHSFENLQRSMTLIERARQQYFSSLRALDQNVADEDSWTAQS